MVFLCNNFCTLVTNILVKKVSMHNILEVKSVVKQYGDYTALNNVSLQVPQRKYLRFARAKWSRKNFVNSYN